MNDFSELEKELRKLRPAQPSPVLFERVGEALKDSRAVASARCQVELVAFHGSAHNWWSLGFGLAAAAVLILFAAVTMERRHEHQQTVAQSSPAPETRPVPLGTERSTSPSRFVPAGGTQSRLQRPRRRIAFC